MCPTLRPHGLQPARLLCPWGCSRQDYWSGGPFPSPGDLPNTGIEPRSPTLQVDSLPAKPLGKPKNTGVGSLSLLPRIFLTQQSNQGLLHCRRILHQLSYQGSPLSPKSGLKTNDSRLYKKRERFGYRGKEHTPRKKLSEDRSRDWRDASTSKTHHVSLAAPEAGKRPEMDSSSEPTEGTKPADTLTLDVWPPEWERVNVCCCKPVQVHTTGTLENQQVCSVMRAEGSAVHSSA